MAFDIATALKIASTALSAFSKLTSFLDDDIDNVTLLSRIGTDIEAVRADVISHINAVRLEELQGRISGLMLTLQTFDPVQTDEQRLVNAIDDGSNLLGELGTIIQNRDDLDTVFGATSLLAWIVALRAIMMAERETVFGNSEIKDIPAMLRIANDHLSVVAQKSNSRFSQLKVGRRTEPGFAQVGFDFAGQFVVLLEVPVNSNGEPVRRFPPFLEERRRSRMTEEYHAIPGVAEILAFDPQSIEEQINNKRDPADPT